ncbi:PcfJ domain-containing protein [Pseudomonadota bacterium]
MQQLNTIGQFPTYQSAALFARKEAVNLNCTCTVRRVNGGGFDVLRAQVDPINEILRLAINSQILSPGADSGALHHSCLEKGLSPSGWRFMCRHGLASAKAALQPTLAQQVQFKNALRLVEWQAQACLQAPLPEPLAERLVIASGLILDEISKIDPRLGEVGARHLSQLTHPLHRKQFIEQEWVRVLVWMRDQQPQLDKNQWRAGWSAIAKQYALWRNKTPGSGEWSSSISRTKIGSWLVEPVDSAYKLTREGIRMKHCVASYADRCLSGEYRVFSVSNAETRKPLATIGFDRDDDEWGLDQIKGKCNQKVSPELLVLANEVLRRYRWATRASV